MMAGACMGPSDDGPERLLTANLTGDRTGCHGVQRRAFSGHRVFLLELIDPITMTGTLLKGGNEFLRADRDHALLDRLWQETGQKWHQSLLVFAGTAMKHGASLIAEKNKGATFLKSENDFPEKLIMCCEGTLAVVLQPF